MDNDQSEDAQLNEQTALYKVSYFYNNELFSVDFILNKNNKKRKMVKGIISQLTKLNLNNISHVKFRFRKYVQGFTPGMEGTNKYNQLIQIQKDLRRKQGQLKRKYTLYKKKHPFKPKSKTIEYSRHRFIDIQDFHQNIQINHQRQNLRYRFDIQLGFHLRNIETDEIMAFYPSENTSIFSENEQIPLINNSVDHLIKDLEQSSLIERLKRPNSKWSVDNIYEYVLLTTPLPGMPIGSKIKFPDYIVNSKSIISFNTDDNMCFWNCLAYCLNSDCRIDRIHRKAVTVFNKYYNKSHSDYKGVDIEELNDIESHFNVNINIYLLENDKAVMERHSFQNYQLTLNLNVFTEIETGRHHFSFIKNIANITKVFQCTNCNSFLSEYKKLKSHAFVCNNGKAKVIFEDGNYNPKPNIFEQLDTFGIQIPTDLRFYPYFIFYDFETWLNKTNSTNGKLQYTGTHELLSISLIGSEEESPIFIPVEATTGEALDIMIRKMEDIRAKYIKNIYQVYNPYFTQINKLNEAKSRKLLCTQLMDWIDTLPVYGFNSSSYDINVVKKYLPHILIKNSKQHGNISKKENQWLQTIENQLQRNLEHNKKIERYDVDGCDKLTNTVYEFNGCFFHGCQKCYDSEEINLMTGHKMKHHYQKTTMKEEKLKVLGYNVISVSECEFNPPDEIEIDNIIKCNNKYKMISNGKFIFKDIIAYLSPGTSLEKYLRAFDTECPKGVFPHRVTQNLDLYFKEHPDLKFD
ncbi:unnamed protein product [Rotaria socialis]|uniref:Uncharacterized protein n=1 Tax=Rotaria socialis TaxID=392032 RepID=A0A819A3K6_9BILA|nr:unnamed protein product [Rotaria socialis]CAF4862767.1 unnamed protein product [Rotaria socialis]